MNDAIRGLAVGSSEDSSSSTGHEIRELLRESKSIGADGRIDSRRTHKTKPINEQAASDGRIIAMFDERFFEFKECDEPPVPDPIKDYSTDDALSLSDRFPTIFGDETSTDNTQSSPMDVFSRSFSSISDGRSSVPQSKSEAAAQYYTPKEIYFMRKNAEIEQE